MTTVDTAPSDPADQWPPWSSFAALAAALVAAIVLGNIANVVLSPNGSHPTHTANLVATYVQDGCFVAAPLWFAWRFGPVTAAAFGLRSPRIALGLCVALVAGGYLLFLIFTAAWTRLLNLHEHEKLLHDLGAHDSRAGLIATALLTCAIAPICEELLFRGYMYRALRNWEGVWPAAIVVGILFGGVHGLSSPAGDLLPLALFGVILCFAYEISGSILVSMSLHSVNNAAAFLSLEHAGAAWYPALIVMSLATIAVLLRGALAVWPAGQTATPRS